MPVRRPGQLAQDLPLGGQTGDRPDEAPVSPREGEEKIYVILDLLDAVMDRCEETARKTS